MINNNLINYKIFMDKYTDIDDDDFYKFINKKYSSYKIPKKNKTLKQICFPKKYEHQIPQKFVAEFINPKTPYTGLLIYHQIGSGKTCSAINIAEKFKNKKTIIIVLPASLKQNFRSELRSLCTGNNYLTKNERSLLTSYHPTSSKYKKIINKSDERIDKYYKIYSYNKFVKLVDSDKITLHNTLLIIDEIHNMISNTGIYYETIYSLFESAPASARTVLLSATPIFDKPHEIALTMNLLIKNKMPTDKLFIETFIDIKCTKNKCSYKIKNKDLFRNYVRGYISYYRGAPPQAYPRVKIHMVKIIMAENQLHLYHKIIGKENIENDALVTLTSNIKNNFFIGTRMISNIVYPNGELGICGFNSLKDEDLKMINLKYYSPKFLKILKKIKKCKGTVFIYSTFKEYGGMRAFIKVLEYHKYKNYVTNGAGTKRYALWSGDQDPLIKEEIKTIFNNKNNEDGSHIKIICATPSAKEGVSFFRIQEVHILEPYWNMSRLNQIIGRAVRYCSHKDVPLENQLVNVYIYIAIHPNIKKSVDQHIMDMAIEKEIINRQFEKLLKEAAIDCNLFENANIYADDEYQCSI